MYLCVGSDQFSALLQTANGGARAEVYSTLMAIYLHQNELYAMISFVVYLHSVCVCYDSLLPY